VLNSLGDALGIEPGGGGEACWETRGRRKSKTGWGRCEASCRNALAAGDAGEEFMQQRDIVRAAIIPG
jgi:hypothetical protein